MTPEEIEAMYALVEARWRDAVYSRRPGPMTDLERKAGTKMSAPFFKKYGG